MNWLLFLLIFIITIPGVLSMTLTERRLIKETKPEEKEIPLITHLLVHTILVLPFAAFGSWLHDYAGLSVPNLTEINGTAWLVGLSCSIVHIILYHGYVRKQLHSKTAAIVDQTRQSMGILTRVLYGGIVEEVIFRWGLMSLLISIGTWLFGKTDIVYWLSILLAAIMFALVHLPGAFQLVEERSTVLITYVMIGNILVGICCGWLLWKVGLFAAILCHILFHLVWYVFEQLKRSRLG